MPACLHNDLARTAASRCNLARDSTLPSLNLGRTIATDTPPTTRASSRPVAAMKHVEGDNTHAAR
ncbi:hypothetical protein XalbCFBP2523_12565 [Xanthomonas albilineans]|nr:hypothetical protein XalbCFBP2523_12565 [Xanthomonas albilineans]